MSIKALHTYIHYMDILWMRSIYFMEYSPTMMNRSLYASKWEIKQINVNNLFYCRVIFITGNTINNQATSIETGFMQK